ncbi:hypothetical protein GCM10011338_18390 [Alteromonas lipolytica]|nr:hypothetical protein GCM10011338_18390 [Alteromonas lipolytica]
MLDDLKNFQTNTETMMSAGLPDEHHFITLKTLGVSRVIDLIPGGRSAEKALLDEMGLEYFNIQVEWEHPTLANFSDYISIMER